MSIPPFSNAPGAALNTSNTWTATQIFSASSGADLISRGLLDSVASTGVLTLGDHTQLYAGTAITVNASTNVISNNAPTSIQATSANAFAVGQNGTTNPAFQINTATASSATGLQIVSAASGGGVAVNTISSGTNEAITITDKGTGGINLTAGGAITLNAASGGVNIKDGATLIFFVNGSQLVAEPASGTVAATVRFRFTGAADTTLTASTEAPSVYFNSGQTRQHSTGAITLQRDFRQTGSTHSFVGASTITDCASFAIDGYGQAGTNATITNAHGLLIQAQAVAGTVGTASAVTLNAPTGATTAYALWVQTGNSLLQTLTINSATMLTTNTNFTNGAGSGVGTLTNAPASTNPTKWIPINDNGTTRYIPAW